MLYWITLGAASLIVLVFLIRFFKQVALKSRVLKGFDEMFPLCPRAPVDLLTEMRDLESTRATALTVLGRVQEAKIIEGHVLAMQLAIAQRETGDHSRPPKSALLGVYDQTQWARDSAVAKALQVLRDAVDDGGGRDSAAIALLETHAAGPTSYEVLSGRVRLP